MNIKYIFLSIIVILLGAVGVLGYKLSKDAKNTNAVNEEMRLYGGNENGMGQGRVDNNEFRQLRRNCLSDDCLAIGDLNYPAGELTENAKSALLKALDDEYKAHATYEEIILKLGSVRPFIMIIRAEEQHVSSLKALFDKYGLTIPENPYTGNITAPTTLVESCSEGVDAEISNVALYKDELLPAVSEYEDITVVFNNLMKASQEKHLPAFQRCAE